jgi:serine/threonine protein phosphatase PrpC
MSAVCGACNAQNPTDASFCESCGSALVSPTAPATPTSATPTSATPTSATPTPLSPAAVPTKATEAAPHEYLPGEAPSGRVGQSTSVSAPVAASSILCTTCSGTVEDTYCTVCGAKQPDPRDHFEITLSPLFAGVCDRGIQHSANQDAMAISYGATPHQAVLVVCDGVTSAPLSERASLAGAEAACQSISAAAKSSTTYTDDFWSAAIQAACTAAQAETVAVARSLGDPPEPPSCTFVVTVVDNGRLHTGWCGDSRAFWLPDEGDGVILSIDDSISSQLIAAGTPRAVAEADPRAHTITRWLGADSPDPTAKTAAMSPTGTGWVAVVSDGMWNYASEPAAMKALIKPGDAISNAQSMVAFANSCGGVDNISVTLFRLVASTDPTRAPQTATATASPPSP